MNNRDLYDPEGRYFEDDDEILCQTDIGPIEDYSTWRSVPFTEDGKALIEWMKYNERNTG